MTGDASSNSTIACPRPDRVRIDIDGMTCAGCVAKVESALNRVDGVRRTTVSLSDGTAVVQGSQLDPDSLAQAVRQHGFGAIASDADELVSVHDQRSSIEHKQAAHAAAWKRRTILGFGAWIPMALLHWGGHTLGLGHLADPRNPWLWVVAGLGTFVQIAVGAGFYRSAIKAALSRTTNMDTLIAIGATASFTFSWVVVALLIARDIGWIATEINQPLYFGEAAGLLSFISVGHWLEARTMAAAGSAIRELLALQPDEVTRVASLDDQVGTTAASADIGPGDLMLIRAGERIGVDGVIRRGSSALDCSAVTGESIPVDHEPGSEVIAGSMNLTGLIIIEATTDGRDTTIARIAEMVRQAQASKANIQRLADRVCAIFVPAVLIIALLTCIGWLILGGEDRILNALVNATTVLVISCPCALGLATPTAVMVGSGAASQKGILVKSAATLERAAGVNRIMLDKTGTITFGHPSVIGVHGRDPDQTLALAGALARGSHHPLSQAVVRAAGDRAIELDHIHIEHLSEKAGQGLSGDWTPRNGSEILRVELLSESAATKRGVIIPPDLIELEAGSCDAHTRSLLVVDQNAIGAIDFQDELRPDADVLIGLIRRIGARPTLLTGDRADVASSIGQAAGFEPNEIFAELTPGQKAHRVRSAAGEGAIVAMVGDGINDAAALAQAGANGGIGVAIATGTNIAIESADAVIPSDQLGAVIDLIWIGRVTLRTIRQNLFLSFVYNVTAIPAAAFGLLGLHGPLIAAAAMALSDVTVIGNSLRLKRRLRLQPATAQRTGTAPGDLSL